MKIIGSATANNGVTYTTYTFLNFIIYPQNTLPPQFRTSLSDLTVEATTYLEYTLPTIYDIDLDGWTVSVNFGLATLFARLNGNKI